jgi:hypothetical protein
MGVQDVKGRMQKFASGSLAPVRTCPNCGGNYLRAGRSSRASRSRLEVRMAAMKKMLDMNSL